MNAATTPRTRHDGFTLIEMIVVLVVLALAMAAIFPAIGNLLTGSSRGAASGQATGEAGLVGKMLEEDIKTALGDRGTGERSDSATFTGADAIRTATIPALTAGATSTLYSDIVSANPTRLVLNADVLAQVGVEQVEWSLTTNSPACGETDAGGSNWCLRRIVRAAGGGGVLAAEVATKSRGTYPQTTSCGGSNLPAATRVFCYQEAYPGNGNNNMYRVDGNWTPNCTLAWTTDPASPNTGTADRTLTSQRYPVRHNMVESPNLHSIARLDRIVTVGASVLAGGGFGKAGERSYENLEIAIRSRENEAYREAIMCGLRAGWGR